MRTATNRLLLSHTLAIASALALLLTCPAQATATHYRSLAPGAYTNTAIWSTDGVNPCGCRPSTVLSNGADSVTVQHAITHPGSVNIVNGANVIVTTGASLTLGGFLSIDGGYATSAGHIQAYGVQVLNFGTLQSSTSLSVGVGSVLFNAGIGIIGGTFTVAGNFLSSNEAYVLFPAFTTGTINGSLQNSAVMVLQTPTCITANIQVTNTATIGGEGHITSHGNTTNTGAWSNLVGWCADGVSTGLTTPEDCITCGPLPLSLLAFEGKASDQAAQLHWKVSGHEGTASFTLTHSTDGQEFSHAATVPASAEADYTWLSEALATGTHYFRLSETDHNGRQRDLGTIEVAIAPAAIAASAWPNPFNDRLVIHTAEGATVTLSDLQGQVLREASGPACQFQGADLAPGMYLVKVSQRGSQQVIRVVKH